MTSLSTEKKTDKKGEKELTKQKKELKKMDPIKELLYNGMKWSAKVDVTKLKDKTITPKKIHKRVHEKITTAKKFAMKQITNVCIAKDCKNKREDTNKLNKDVHLCKDHIKTRNDALFKFVKNSKSKFQKSSEIMKFSNSVEIFAKTNDNNNDFKYETFYFEDLMTSLYFTRIQITAYQKVSKDTKIIEGLKQYSRGLDEIMNALYRFKLFYNPWYDAIYTKFIIPAIELLGLDSVWNGRINLLQFISQHLDTICFFVGNVLGPLLCLALGISVTYVCHQRSNNDRQRKNVMLGSSLGLVVGGLVGLALGPVGVVTSVAVAFAGVGMSTGALLGFLFSDNGPNGALPDVDDHFLNLFVP